MAKGKSNPAELPAGMTFAEPGKHASKWSAGNSRGDQATQGWLVPALRAAIEHAGQSIQVRSFAHRSSASSSAWSIHNGAEGRYAKWFAEVDYRGNFTTALEPEDPSDKKGTTIMYLRYTEEDEQEQ